MKLVFCNNNLEGLYRFRKEVLQHFAQQGHEIILLYPCHKEDKYTKDLLSGYCRFITVHMNPTGKNPIEDIISFIQLRHIYKKENPDIVINYTIKPNIYSTLAAKSLRIPSISMMAGLGYSFDGNSVAKRLARSLYKLGLNASDKVIVLNENNYDRVADIYIPKERLVLFEGGEGVNMKDYPYKKNEFDEIRFLMVARLMYNKGYQQFIDAAEIVKNHYPSVHFELLGSLCPSNPAGVSEATLKKDLQKGNIEYLGATKDVTSIVLRDGVVVVVPSFYLEGMNRSLMEACSMGRPIITTDIPGCKEIVIDGRNGYCVQAKSAEALADACIKFIQLTAIEKEKMAYASYEKCKNQFDISKVIVKYDELISSIIQ